MSVRSSSRTEVKSATGVPAPCWPGGDHVRGLVIKNVELNTRTVMFNGTRSAQHDCSLPRMRTIALQAIRSHELPLTCVSGKSPSSGRCQYKGIYSVSTWGSPVRRYIYIKAAVNMSASYEPSLSWLTCWPVLVPSAIWSAVLLLVSIVCLEALCYMYSVYSISYIVLCLIPLQSVCCCVISVVFISVRMYYQHTTYKIDVLILYIVLGLRVH